MYQIIIKNGMVIDPGNGLFQQADVAVADGKIAGVGVFEADGTMVVDASGCLVTPGLIDHHCHLYPMAKIGIPAEAMCFPSGVTTAVDAGSTGCATFAGHLPAMEGGKLTVKAYLNVCSDGLDSLPRRMEEVAPETYDRGAIREVFQQYGSSLLGLKLRTSREIVGELGYSPLRETVKLADWLGVSVMVHCTNPPGKMEELLSCLRPGDVITHMYMNKGSTILGEDGAVSRSALDARARGVIFEAADARAHFSFAVSEPAIAQGFLPDIIATDLTRLSMNLRPTAFSMANQLAKYHMLGIPLERLIACCTSVPARHMGLEGQAGCLSPGAWGDVAVFQLADRETQFGDRPFSDPACQLRSGTRCLRPVLTVKNGETVFRDIMF